MFQGILLKSNGSATIASRPETTDRYRPRLTSKAAPDCDWSKVNLGTTVGVDHQLDIDCASLGQSAHLYTSEHTGTLVPRTKWAENT
ncbi:hypothetical protein J6590_068872 [Homalodisca vitripennis]|nr:hypothetical protein J6590_068872 [Homalodisca vitripennis]